MSGCGRLARGVLEQVVLVETVAVPLSCPVPAGPASGRSGLALLVRAERLAAREGGNDLRSVARSGTGARQEAGHLTVGDDDVAVRDGHAERVDVVGSRPASILSTSIEVMKTRAPDPAYRPTRPADVTLPLAAAIWSQDSVAMAFNLLK